MAEEDAGVRDAHLEEGRQGEAEAGQIELSLTVGEIEAENPAVAGFLDELGFEGVLPDETLPELCERSGVDLSIVVMSLEMAGFEVLGYEAPEAGAAAELLDNIFTVLFDASSDPVLGGAPSQSPMFAHMEAAIRRAQKKGELPGDPASGTS